MFEDIGNKVCGLAKVIFFIGLIVIAVGILCICAGDEFYFFCGIIALAGGLIAMFSSRPLYAFGQITNEIHELREACFENEDEIRLAPDTKEQTQAQSQNATVFHCPACAAPINYAEENCHNCGQKLDWNRN